jgi:hypothetical protein
VAQQYGGVLNPAIKEDQEQQRTLTARDEALERSVDETVVDSRDCRLMPAAKKGEDGSRNCRVALTADAESRFLNAATGAGAMG